MKTNIKILCVMLALLMCLSTATFAVSAEENNTSTDKMYKELVFDSLGDRVNEHYSYRCEYVYNSDGSIPNEGEMPEFILCHISSCVVYDVVVECVIGDYYFSQGYMHEPFALGYCIYSVEENKCYSLEEAWDTQLPQTETVLAMLGTPVDKPDQTYKDIVFEALGDKINPEYQRYSCIYAYNADGSTVDEGETPDYILAWTGAGGADAIVERVIGDYYFISGAILNPFDLGYCICSTKEHKCYSLDEAWEAQLPNIESAFAKAGTHVDVANNELTRYRTKIMSMLGWKNTDEDIKYRCIAEYTADGAEAPEGATPDYAVVFAHQGAWTEEAIHSVIGNYRLNVSNDFSPGLLIYSIAEDKLYKVREAYNLDLPCIDLALEKIGTKVSLYAEVFEEFLKPSKDEGPEGPLYGWYVYDELYYYSYQKRYGSTEMFEVTPDYVLVDAMAYHSPPIDAYEVIGDYLVTCGCGNPDNLRYYVYTPEDGKIYTLAKAFEAGIKDIDKIFTDYGLGTLMGDLDNDEKLTIKDATYLQKCLAKFEGFVLPETASGLTDGDIYIMPNIANVDKDGKITIKDATAIQKKLAKI